LIQLPIQVGNDANFVTNSPGQAVAVPASYDDSICVGWTTAGGQTEGHDEGLNICCNRLSGNV